MNFKNLAIIGLIGTLLVTWEKACVAQPNPDAYLNDVKQKAMSIWDCSESTEVRISVLRCMVSHHRNVGKIQVIKSSGSPQYDAECAEALCSQNPITGWELFDTFWPYEVEFSPNSLFPKFTGIDIKAYAKEHPLDKSKTVLIHKIPLSVLTVFPGLFTLKELMSSSNLLEVPISGPSNESYLHVLNTRYQKIGNIYYKKNFGLGLDKEHVVTRAEILDALN